MLGRLGMDSETLTRKFPTFPFPPKLTLGDPPLLQVQLHLVFKCVRSDWPHAEPFWLSRLVRYEATMAFTGGEMDPFKGFPGCLNVGVDFGMKRAPIFATTCPPSLNTETSNK